METGTWIRTTGVRMAEMLNKTEERLTGPCEDQHVELAYTIWGNTRCCTRFGKLVGSTVAELIPAL